MAEETTTGVRPFRSPSIVVVEWPNGSNRQRIEVARDRVWPDTEEGRVLQLTHRVEG